MRIHTVAIPTRDDPAQLERALSSCFAEGARWDRRFDVLVMDDSTCARSVEDNQQLLARVARGRVVEHATPERRRAFVEALGREVGDREAVAFGLLGLGDGPRFGAVRNAIALELSGRPFFSLDDDMSLRGYRAPGAGDERVTSTGDPTHVSLLASEEQARAGAEGEPVDVLFAHERLLGARHDGASIVATWTGFYGHCATPSPLLYLLPPEQAAAPWRGGSAGAFDAVAGSRQIIRFVRAPTAGTGGFWTTGAAAYGLESPPFFPVLRGEGLVFGALVAASARVALGYVPVVVEHRSRALAGGEFIDFERAGSQTSLAPAVAGLLHWLAQRLRASGAEVTFRNLGRALSAVCEKPGELERLVAAQLLARSRYFVAKLREHASTAGRASCGWSAAAERYLAGAERAQALGMTVPTDFCEMAGSSSAPSAVMEKTIGAFARLLELWPRLHVCSRRLAAEGVRAAQAVAA